MNDITQAPPTDITAAVPAAPHKIGMSELLLDLKATAPQDYQALSNFIHSMDDVLKPEVVGEVFKESTAKALLTANLALAGVDSGLVDLQQKEEAGLIKYDTATVNGFFEAFHGVIKDMGGVQSFVKTLEMTSVYNMEASAGLFELAHRFSSLPENAQHSLTKHLTSDAYNGLSNILELSNIYDLRNSSKHDVSTYPSNQISDVQHETRLVEMQNVKYK
jgi:hypothetical protein